MADTRFCPIHGMVDFCHSWSTQLTCWLNKNWFTILRNNRMRIVDLYFWTSCKKVNWALRWWTHVSIQYDPCAAYGKVFLFSRLTKSINLLVNNVYSQQIERHFKCAPRKWTDSSVGGHTFLYLTQWQPMERSSFLRLDRFIQHGVRRRNEYRDLQQKLDT